MQEESLHVVFVTAIPQKEQSEATYHSEPNGQKQNSSEELFQSSVDSPGFMAKQKRRLTESHVGNKIHKAKTESQGKCSLLRRLFINLATSTCFTFMLTTLMFIPLSKVIIGAIFFDECPAEPFIPLYLVVGGTVACARDLLNICMRSVLSDKAFREHDVPITLVAFVYTMAEFTWFVYGSIYVYSMFNSYQWKDRTAEKYCSSILYMYAFVLTTMSYFLLFVTCTLSGAAVCAAYFLEFPGPQEPVATVVVIQQERPGGHIQQQQQLQVQDQQHRQPSQQQVSLQSDQHRLSPE